MELKPMSAEDKRLFLDDALVGVPPVYVGEKRSEDSFEECGDCYIQLTCHATKQDYERFLSDAESCGWETIISHDEPLQGKVYTRAFRKDRRILGVIFYDFDGTFLPPKLFISISLIPEYRILNGDDLFPDLPAFSGIEAYDCGEGNFIKTKEDATRSDYDGAVSALRKDGWKKETDNEPGLYGCVFTTLLTKEERTASVLYTARSRRLYLTVGNEAVCPRLFRDPSETENLPEDERTSLHMPEQWHFGNSFVIRLKNGHFLVNDGGHRCETPYLLDYLDSLTKDGETPVIDGWFFSHGHGDHVGVLIELAVDERWRDRIVVNGIYFSTPSVEMLQLDAGGLGIMGLMRLSAKNLRTSSGEPTPFYRMRTGERYYFCDVTVDVLMSQELLRFCDCSGDLNDSTTWLVFNIEGQRVLLAGDGDKGEMRLLMENYPKEVMHFDVMGLLHHGWNTRDWFTDFCCADTVLFTCYKNGPSRKKAEIDHLKSIVKEYFPWGDGTILLRFPYRVGEAERLPRFKWKYNVGEVHPNMPNDPEPRD